MADLLEELRRLEPPDHDGPLPRLEDITSEVRQTLETADEMREHLRYLHDARAWPLPECAKSYDAARQALAAKLGAGK